jgi:hypothetical protein
MFGLNPYFADSFFEQDKAGVHIYYPFLLSKKGYQVSFEQKVRMITRHYRFNFWLFLAVEIALLTSIFFGVFEADITRFLGDAHSAWYSSLFKYQLLQAILGSYIFLYIGFQYGSCCSLSFYWGDHVRQRKYRNKKERYPGMWAYAFFYGLIVLFFIGWGVYWRFVLHERISWMYSLFLLILFIFFFRHPLKIFGKYQQEKNDYSENGLKKITTDIEYKNALAQFDRVVRHDPGALDSVPLKNLMDTINSYEKQHFY